jgi:DNA repair protein RadC
MTAKTVKKFSLTANYIDLTIPTLTISTSKNAFEVCEEIHQLEGNNFQEFFYVVFLNQANKVTGYYLASMGGVTGTVADPRIIIKAAALSDCVSVILCHNHPSGALKPSKQDEDLTAKIKEAARFFDIKVVDHIIYSEAGYFSFADEGIL